VKRYALIVGTLVVNVAVATDAQVFARTGFTVEEVPAALPVAAGWTFAGGVFVPPAPTLEQAKLAKIAEIDFKSYKLLELGFEFSGQTFPLGSEARAQFAHMEQFAASLIYPFSIPTLDQMSSVTMTTPLDVGAFVAPGVVRADTVFAEGTALIVQVQACTTVAQVEAIQDTRT
jgi:hypothetical protein